MRRPALCALLGAFIGLAGQPSGAAATTTAVEAAQQVVTIPFAPPLGETLRYMMNRTAARTGAPISVRLELRFERQAKGYRLHTRTLPIGLPADDRITPLMSRPITFLLDEEANFVGLEDEAAYWREVEALVGQVLTLKDDERALVTRFVADMKALPDEQRIMLMARNFVPVVAMSAIEMSPGETIEVRDDAMLPIAGNPVIPRITRQTMERAAAGEVLLRRVTSYDQQAFKAAMTKLMSLAPRPPAEPIPDLNITNKASYSVDPATGLVLRFEEVIAAEGKEEGKRITRLVREPASTPR